METQVFLEISIGGRQAQPEEPVQKRSFNKVSLVTLDNNKVNTEEIDRGW